MPGLLTLPDEVLLLILREPSLTYNDLKRVSRVSMRLHSLEQDESLDLKLFRKHLPAPSSSSTDDQIVLCKRGVEVKNHPILDRADLTADDLDEADVFGLDNVFLSDLACYHEMATSPPCRVLNFAMGGRPRARNETGVTVEDAIVTAVEMWDEELNEIDERLYFDDPFSDEGRAHTWRDLLGDHCCWEGVREVTVIEPDVVSLRPESFGS
ncbi:hypothetical protein JCM3766R1_002117 [Sporobolomyces carnicolor]